MSGADSLSPLKRALVELRELRAQLARAERVRIDPVAIVGVGLRLPGGLSTPDEFWDFLLRGGDAITEVPSDRWSADAFSHSADESCGTIVTRFGGFLRGIEIVERSVQRATVRFGLVGHGDEPHELRRALSVLRGLAHRVVSIAAPVEERGDLSLSRALERDLHARRAMLREHHRRAWRIVFGRLPGRRPRNDGGLTGGGETALEESGKA